MADNTPTFIVAGLSVSAAIAANFISGLFSRRNVDVQRRDGERDRLEAASAKRIADWEASVGNDNKRLREENERKDDQIRRLEQRVTELERQIEDLRRHISYMDTQRGEPQRRPPVMTDPADMET